MIIVVQTLWLWRTGDSDVRQRPPGPGPGTSLSVLTTATKTTCRPRATTLNPPTTTTYLLPALALRRGALRPLAAAILPTRQCLAHHRRTAWISCGLLLGTWKRSGLQTDPMQSVAPGTTSITSIVVSARPSEMALSCAHILFTLYTPRAIMAEVFGRGRSRKTGRRSDVVVIESAAWK